MKTIGIIASVDREISLVHERAEIVATKNAIGLQFYMGRMHGKSIVLVKCGIGKVNAAICTQILIDHFAVDYVINIGGAFAIYDELKTGDIVISSDAVQHDMNISLFGDPIGSIPKMTNSFLKADEELIRIANDACSLLGINSKIIIGRIASGDFLGFSIADKKKIWNSVKGYSADGESAAVAHACYLNKIPFIIIRSMLDDASQELHVLDENTLQDAAKVLDILIDEMMKKL